MSNKNNKKQSFSNNNLNKKIKGKGLGNKEINDQTLNQETINQEISPEQIEVVKKFVRFEENNYEYMKLVYGKHKKILNVLALVSIVLVVYLLLILSAKKNGAQTENSEVESVSSEAISSQNKNNTSNTNQESNSSDNSFKSKEKSSGKVYITGEVLNPDVYDIKEGDRIEDVINYAGGVTEDANLDIINLSEIVADEQHIIIPNETETETETGNEGDLGSSGGSSNSNSTKVNINKASLEELKSISGVGDTIATNIIQYREENGNFKSIDEIKNVDGVGEKSFEKMKPQITVK